MTKIDLDTSPLQAAREWRGASLVSVAMNCGLPVAQAEALESGDPGAFDSVDEMIAAAVVYGASMGIGRDEAMALLDRTVGREAAVAELPDTPATPATAARPNGAFSGAVQERSARIADRPDIVATPPIAVPPAAEDGDDDQLDAAGVDAPLSQDLLAGAAAAADAAVAADAAFELEIDLPELPEMPAVPNGPTPEQAVAASGELHLDEAFGPDAPWEHGTGNTGELEAWVDDYEEDSFSPARRSRVDGEGIMARVGASSHAALERIIGSDRADAVADRTRELSVRASELARQGREKLRRSEHATLIVAIGAGAILIAIVVALGGALGGNDNAGPGRPDTTAATTAAQKADTAADTKAATPAASKAMLPPAKINVDVYNAGSQKGKAKTVADKLTAAGYHIGEVTNSKTDYAGARIIYPKGMAREARALARRTGISSLAEAPGSTRRVTVIVT
ncbi:MAG: LytR C-terminal domain-containing protein [Thermoleophilia bacterium]|nr:LytR C-terminal domain-containing protein [Thermoleophilia bacterium]